jgi:hypothetical protein
MASCIDVARMAPVGHNARRVDEIELCTTPRGGRKELALRCVASGYLAEDCSCDHTIPAGVVIAAWARELEREGGERFFHFAWHDGVWLGYGLEDGLVRGLYCPSHSAARDERSFSYGSRDGAAPDRLAIGA